MNTYLKKLKPLRIAILSVLMVSFMACNKDNDNKVEDRSGQASIKMTDAPIDNAEVQGVFVTVTDVKVNGKSASNFEGKTTVDLMALQNGNTRLVTTEQLNAGTYNDIAFTLDLATDASGNTPGCYVLTSSGKQALEMGNQTSAELIASGSYYVAANSNKDVIVDFDLRKLIKEESGIVSDGYTFVTQTEANAALRLVEENQTGTIYGDVNMSTFNNADKVVVYAYNKGTFDADTETNGQGSSNVEFANAVSSATVVEGTTMDSFEMNFMEKGEYELVFAAYSESTLTNEMEFQGFLETDLGVSGDITDLISVNAGGNVQLTFEITAFWN